MDLAYESLSNQLHQRFPKLAEQKYTSLVGNINVDSEPFVLYGVIFSHYLTDLASGGDIESEKEAAEFLEEMATSSDSHVTFLLTSELLPSIVRDQAMLNSFWPLLGPITRRRITLLPPKILNKVDLPPAV